MPVLSMFMRGLGEYDRGLVFDQVRAESTIRNALVRRDPTIFVAEARRGDVWSQIGFMTAAARVYGASPGAFLIADAFYVLPEHRGTRAAAALMEQLDVMAAEIDAREIFFAAGSASRSDAAKARFLRRWGFQPYGTTMRRTP